MIEKAMIKLREIKSSCSERFLQ